jgi:DNA-binding beta-propeller fold protein YncE
VNRGDSRRVLLLLVALILAGCTASRASSDSATESTPKPSPPPSSSNASDALPGMPPVSDPNNVYSAAGAGMLSEPTRSAKPLVYVPHTSGEVWVIDPATFAVVGRYPAGIEVQHVVPSYDMRTLYATDDRGDHVLSFDPATGKPGAMIPAVDPYNLYFTPDGRFAISVAERLHSLVWYEPHTWKEMDRTPMPACAGADHADFSANGRTMLVSCEFAGRVAAVDVASHQLRQVIDMPHRNSRMGPQDVKLAPDGSVFFVADADEGGLWVIDGAATRVLRFIATGHGAHGIYLDREAKRMFVTNRHAGTISVLDARTGATQTTWPIAGGSPDMGNLTADGTQLWLSGRYNREVYVLSTVDGRLLARIPVAPGPHGLCVWPQPGRYSLGHTGITR